MSSSNDFSVLNEQLKSLTASVLASEQRMRRMERRNHFVFSALLGALGVSLYLGSSGFGTSQALAENVVEQDIKTAQADFAKTEPKTAADLIKARADFNARIEAIRADLGKAKNAKQDTGKMIAVLLHDIKMALAAVPTMATNMGTMSRDMTVMTANVDQMNRKLTVMTGSVDSTMGRMGRMMPWW